VLDVLIAEYRFALVRRAYRRVEIDALVSKAKERLERERQDPTGEAQNLSSHHHSIADQLQVLTLSI
jgi:hypothetical protein